MFDPVLITPPPVVPTQRPIPGVRLARQERIDFFIFLTLVALAAQGSVNLIVRGTIFESWKQVIIAILLVYSASRLAAWRTTRLYLLVVFGSGLLATSSLIGGIDVEHVLVNLLFYISWLPFYVLASTSSLALSSKRSAGVVIALIVSSAIGLTLQLKTNLLDFLTDEASLYYFQNLASGLEARRYAFIFVASTLVMPTLLGFFRILCFGVVSTPIRLVTLACLGLSAVATASLAAAFLLVISTGLAVIRVSLLKRVTALTAVVVLSPFLVDWGGEEFGIQIARIVRNDESSESNQGRIALWEGAIETIGRMVPGEHVVGLGLGTTNDRSGRTLLVMHGESSFFQSYIEGGWVGLLLRLAPFWLLIFARRSAPEVEDVLYGISIFLCCAAAPIFGYFGVQCIVGYLAGLATRRNLLSERPAASCNQARLKLSNGIQWV
jgi:hypothetical protein